MLKACNIYRSVLLIGSKRQGLTLGVPFRKVSIHLLGEHSWRGVAVSAPLMFAIFLRGMRTNGPFLRRGNVTVLFTFFF